MCPSDDKKLFDLSEKGQANSVNELTENLEALLRQLKNDKTVIRSSAEQNLPIVISKNKLHEEKDFAKKKLINFSKKQKQQPFAKTKKPNEDLELNVPIVTSVEDL